MRIIGKDKDIVFECIEYINSKIKNKIVLINYINDEFSSIIYFEFKDKLSERGCILEIKYINEILVNTKFTCVFYYK